MPFLFLPPSRQWQRAGTCGPSTQDCQNSFERVTVQLHLLGPVVNPEGKGYRTLPATCATRCLAGWLAVHGSTSQQQQHMHGGALSQARCKSKVRPRTQVHLQWLLRRSSMMMGCACLRSLCTTGQCLLVSGAIVRPDGCCKRFSLLQNQGPYLSLDRETDMVPDSAAN